MGKKPLRTGNQEYTKIGSLKGRGACLLELGQTIFREPYRVVKNVILVAERILDFGLSIIECIFQEHKNDGDWKVCGDKSKLLLQNCGALPGHLINWVLDIGKLSAGVIVPSAAITFKVDPPPPDESTGKTPIIET